MKDIPKDLIMPVFLPRFEYLVPKDETREKTCTCLACTGKHPFVHGEGVLWFETHVWR
jgi:hypothetical protein